MNEFLVDLDHTMSLDVDMLSDDEHNFTIDADLGEDLGFLFESMDSDWIVSN